MTDQGSTSASGQQRRRAPRLKTGLHVQVVGVDAELRSTTGDISMGGLYFDTDCDIGELGSVQRLRMASPSMAAQISLLARVVRIATVSDFWRGSVIAGVAFQFMFEELQLSGQSTTVPIEQSVGVREFMNALAREAGEAGKQGAQLDHVWQATLESSLGAEQVATVTGLSLQGTVLETDFPVPVGEMIRVEIPGPDGVQRIPLVGRATETRPLGDGSKRFRTSLSFEPQAERAQVRPASIQAALGALLTAAPAISSSHPAKQHLAGDLTRISMPTVLMVCELERATGILQLTARDQRVSCYVVEGRLVDVESTISGDPQQALAAVLDWQSGSFEFLFQPMTRADRIGMPVSALLLTLIHMRDEKLR